METRAHGVTGAAAGEPRVLVLGMGATGVSCARYFAARGECVAFADTRVSPPGLEAIRSIMPGARLYTGADSGGLDHSIERVVVSPGVPVDGLLLQSARERGLEILGDIDLFMAECRAPVVAITGSNGKSTVTSMVAAALQSAGWNALAGANLGTPALDLLDVAADAYVLELSSFQLERNRPVKAAAAVLLNLSPDHLDTHGGIEAYQQAKQRVYAACRHAIVNRDEPALAAGIARDVAVTGFTLHEPGPGDFGLRMRDGRTFLACGEALLLPATELQVAGRHNIANALAALALGAAVGADLHGMTSGLHEFTGLPHRMQVVSRADGITWIDDSKATNVGAAVTSITGVTGPLVLIAGGDGKGAQFDELATALRGRQATAILLGRDRERLAECLRPVCDVREVNDMAAAVAMARGIVRPGATVLLAPACSSLDMYRDYAERGDLFAAAVSGGES